MKIDLPFQLMVKVVKTVIFFSNMLHFIYSIYTITPTKKPPVLPCT